MESFIVDLDEMLFIVDLDEVLLIAEEDVDEKE